MGPKKTGVLNGINNALSIRGVVAMSSDSAVVATGSRVNNGEIRVFKNEGGSLEQLGATFEGLQQGDDSAFVSLSGDGQILAIASSKFASVSDSELGFVKVYEYNQSSKTWDEQESAAIVEAGSTRSGWFGANGQLQLSSDGQSLVVGNYMKNNQQGQSTVYKIDGSQSQSVWVKVNDFNGAQAGDKVGHGNALSSDGNVLAIGAAGKNSVTMYEYNSVSKVYDMKKTISAPASTVDFGAALSLSADGQTIAIGAAAADDIVRKAFVYQQDVAGNWVQQGGVISGIQVGDEAPYGAFLSDDGTTVALSSPSYDTDKGRIHVYDLVDDAWIQKGNDILGANANDVLGDFVLSGDGDTIFAGALGAGYTATYKYLDNWKIQAPVVTMDATSTDSSVYHLIGDMPIDADVKLFDKDCKTLVGSGNVISISTKSFTKEHHQLLYTFSVDMSQIGSSSLVSFVDESQFQQSKGSISFCTRAETYYQPSFDTDTALASYLETNFVMNFDLTQNDFSTADNSFTIVANVISDQIEEVIVDVNTESGINSCFCTNVSFACITEDVPTFNQDESAYVCLEPRSPDLKISNLAMKLTANGFIYRAVEFGNPGWDVDAMTSIISDTASDKIQVKVNLPGGLFSDMESEMTIEGNAFMQFKSSGKMLELTPYNLTASVGADADEECSRGFGLLSKLFKLVDNIF